MIDTSIVRVHQHAATRYDKLAANYLAFMRVATIRLWLRVYEFAACVQIRCLASRMTSPTALWPNFRRLLWAGRVPVNRGGPPSGRRGLAATRDNAIACALIRNPATSSVLSCLVPSLGRANETALRCRRQTN